MRVYSKKEKETFAKLVLADVPYADICRAMGIGRSLAFFWRGKMGLARRHKEWHRAATTKKGRPTGK